MKFLIRSRSEGVHLIIEVARSEVFILIIYNLVGTKGFNNLSSCVNSFYSELDYLYMEEV